MKRVSMVILLGHTMFAGAAERPQDFAYAIAIQADAQDALYQVEIPAAVYRGVTRADLGDLRVFNAQGEIVPHAFKPRATGSAEKAAAIELPLFPLYAESGVEVEGMDVRIQKRADGTIVNIVSHGKNVAAQRKLRGYVLDASGLAKPLQALSFDWTSAGEGFAGKVRIEGSDDLARWNVLVPDAPLVSLEFGGHSLQQKRVELRAQKHKYLRVSWPQNQKPLELVSVRAEPAASIVEAQRVWQAFAAPSAGGKTGEYEYDLGGHFPFDRARVELPQVNTLAQLQMLSRSKPDENWRPVTNATVYRLRREGEDLKSPDIVASGRGERYWLLRVDQKGGGIGAGVPVLNIGWVPQQLVFTARGAGPFQLAYGNREAKAVAYPIDSLIPGYKTETELRVKPAKLGEPVTLAGVSRLREPVDYRKWALWASLVLGVAVLGWMAYRLSRQMVKPHPDSAEQSPPADRAD
jgi:hypothetical protein